jgi:transcriptional regulator with GAF, ATPase, and Fis domain
MQKYRIGKVLTEGTNENLFLRPSDDSLRSRTWRNWCLLAGVTIVTTIGLGVALSPIQEKSTVKPWPWANTDLVLLACLAIIVLAFIFYLTQQQRRSLAISSQLQQLKKNTYEERCKHDTQLYALFNVCHIIGTQTDLQGVFDGITKLCLDAFNSHRASLMLYDDEAKELTVKSASGHNNAMIIGTRKKIGEGISGWAAEHRESLFLVNDQDLGRYPGLKLESPSITSAMVVPIILRDELVGVLNVSSRSPEVSYDEGDLKALQVFAENAGAFIRHQQHAEWMRKTIQRLERALREKDRQLHNLNR